MASALSSLIRRTRHGVWVTGIRSYMNCSPAQATPELLVSRCLSFVTLCSITSNLFSSRALPKLLLTIGNALLPLEYAIVKDFSEYLGDILAGHYRGEEFEQMHNRLEDFRAAAGPALIMGVFRASAF